MLSLWILAALMCAARAAPDGAPETACADMTPQHGPAGPQDPDTVITTLSADDNGDGTFTVTLTAKDPAVPFKGFFLQARRAGSTAPEGLFSEYDMDVVQSRPCPRGSEDANGVTHVSNAAKTEVSAVWAAPEGETGAFQIMATIVEVNSGGTDLHWVGQTVDINVQ